MQKYNSIMDFAKEKKSEVQSLLAQAENSLYKQQEIEIKKRFKILILEDCAYDFPYFIVPITFTIHRNIITTPAIVDKIKSPSVILIGNYDKSVPKYPDHFWSLVICPGCGKYVKMIRPIASPIDLAIAMTTEITQDTLFSHPCKKETVEWQLICHNTYRLEVVGGWVVAIKKFPTLQQPLLSDDNKNQTISTVFVPDASHSWKI